MKQKYENLVSKANELGDLDTIEIMIRKIVNYHNNVVDMEVRMSIQRFRLDQDQFAEWLSEQNNHRVKSHQAMIDAVIILNRYANMVGVEPLYSGKIDTELRYNDADTRFGIAKFADEFCSEIFKAGMGDKINF